MKIDRDGSTDIGGKSSPNRSFCCVLCRKGLFSDDPWGEVCGLWAWGNGWRKPLPSEPQLCYRQIRLAEWNSFVQLLSNPAEIYPPSSLMFSTSSKATNKLITFWLEETGLTRLWLNTIEDYNLSRGYGRQEQLPPIIKTIFNSYPMIRKLANNYVSFWRNKYLP